MLNDFYEDIEVGRSGVLGTYEFTRDKIVAFASRYDPHPFHLSEEEARKSHFGRLSASGWHTGAAFMSCFARALLGERDEGTPKRGRWPEIAPSPGFENLRWIRPVYAGDSITYTLTISGKRALNSRPRYGLMFFKVEGRNQDGETVFSLDGKVLMERLEVAQAADEDQPVS